LGYPAPTIAAFRIAADRLSFLVINSD